ncbi:MAG: DUF3313 domain-containing protein [Acinetobacter sp.]
MISIKRLLPLLLASSYLLITGCATQPTTPTRYQQLESSRYLWPNQGINQDKVPYAYSTNVKWYNYSSVVIDPVVIYKGTDNQFGEMSQSAKQDLAHYMQQTFSNTLAKRFEVSSQAKPNTLRIKLTLTGAKANTPVISTFTRFDLMGLSINSVKAAQGKEGIFIGNVHYGVEVYDASNNRLLKAYIAKQYPNAMNIGATFSRLSAAKIGLDKAAQDLLEQLR